MIQIQTQYTPEDLKEATAKVNRLNRQRVSTKAKLLYIGATALLILLLLVAAALTKGTNSPNSVESPASRFFVLLVIDVFVYGLFGFLLLCVYPKHMMRPLIWFGLILGIAVVVRALGSANVPPPTEPPPLPADTPQWVYIAGNGLLFWTLFGVAVWVAIIHMMRTQRLHHWQLQHHLQLPVEITLTEDEVRFRTHVADQHYQWAAFCRWLETENLFILQPSLGLMEMIPKRSFTSGEQVEEARRLMEARVPNGNTSKAGFPVLPPNATSPTPVSSTTPETL